MAPPATTAAPAAPTSSGKKRKAHDDADVQQENSGHKQRQLCAAEPFPPQQPIQNEYELQRQQRIERNRQIMQELGVEQAAAAVRQSMNSSKRQRTANKKKVRQQWRQVYGCVACRRDVLASGPCGGCVLSLKLLLLLGCCRRQQQRLPRPPTGAPTGSQHSRLRCQQQRQTQQWMLTTKILVSRSCSRAASCQSSDMAAGSCLCKLQQQQQRQSSCRIILNVSLLCVLCCGCCCRSDHAALLTQEEYFKFIGQDMLAELESDGKFKG